MSFWLRGQLRCTTLDPGADAPPGCYRPRHGHAVTGGVFGACALALQSVCCIETAVSSSNRCLPASSCLGSDLGPL